MFVVRTLVRFFLRPPSDSPNARVGGGEETTLSTDTESNDIHIHEDLSSMGLW